MSFLRNGQSSNFVLDMGPKRNNKNQRIIVKKLYTGPEYKPSKNQRIRVNLINFKLKFQQ